LDHGGPYPEKPNYSLAATVSTTVFFAGYYTIGMPKKVPVKKDQKFMIVLAGSIADKWGAEIGIECPGPGYSSVITNRVRGTLVVMGRHGRT